MAGFLLSPCKFGNNVVGSKQKRSKHRKGRMSYDRAREDRPEEWYLWAVVVLCIDVCFGGTRGGGSCFSFLSPKGDAGVVRRLVGVAGPPLFICLRGVFLILWSAVRLR